jgi:hypothetical protein
MHKDFYASGFLYHLPSGQILLQQSTLDPSSLWSLFGKQGLYKESPEVTFQRVIYDLLHVKLPLTTIYPIYTYFYKDIHKDHAVVYAEVEDTKRFSSLNTVKCAWFTLKQVLKLDLSEQTRHDITVGQRVINARMRKSLSLQTLE